MVWKAAGELYDGRGEMMSQEEMKSYNEHQEYSLEYKGAEKSALWRVFMTGSAA